MSCIAPALQAFFTDRLITQRNSSPETIASYRDTMRLLLGYVHEQTGKQPFQLDFADLDASMIGAFLTHLESDRGNSTRTRNNRLAAIHSFFRYAALEHPEHAQTIARVMAIPTKRYQGKDISYLDRTEIKALLKAPDRSSWLGRRKSRHASHPHPNRPPRIRTHPPPSGRPPPRHHRTRPSHRQGEETAHRHTDP